MSDDCTNADCVRNDKMMSLFLALLDRIEIEEDSTLASQRHDIARSCGLTVEFGEKISGMVN